MGPNGQREPIYAFKTSGGLHLQHAFLKEIPDYDETAIDDLSSDGLIAIDYISTNSMAITPTRSVT